MQVEIIDNSKLVLDEFKDAVMRALERCGLQAEGYAADLAPVDTGNLRDHISHTVDASEPAAYVGTNTEYAPYVELGTGIHYPGGRDTPWIYQDAKGDWHRTNGQRPQPWSISTSYPPFCLFLISIVFCSATPPSTNHKIREIIR